MRDQPNYAPEVGQARVQEKLAQITPQQPKAAPSQEEEEPEVEPTPEPVAQKSPASAPLTPMEEALEALPDGDVQKLLQQFKVQVTGGYDRTKAIKLLSSLGVTPTDLT